MVDSRRVVKFGSCQRYLRRKEQRRLIAPLKTFCARFPGATEWPSEQPVPITGWAQVGMSGLKSVQVWIHDRKQTWPRDDPHFVRAPWKDVDILPAPDDWGGEISGGDIPEPTHGFADGHPQQWPMRLTKVHWATLQPGLPPGDYTIRCRTIDAKGNAQPMPRPFRKSGHAAIQQTRLVVK